MKAVGSSVAEPTGPPSTANAPAPTVYMPASPALGDVFKQEDVAPIVDETDTVKDVCLKVHVPAGSFPNCIRVLGDHDAEGQARDEVVRGGRRPDQEQDARREVRAHRFDVAAAVVTQRAADIV
jgi:hypothetical protein